MKYTGALVSMLLLAALGGCAQAPTRSTTSSEAELEAEGLTPVFRACYNEAKVPWITSVVAGKTASQEDADKAVAQLGGRTAEEKERTRGYLADLRAGKYSDGEELAGKVFDACMDQRSAKQKNPGRSAHCFREQRVLFWGTQLRFQRNLSRDEATNLLLKEKTDPDVELVVRRLMRDVYLVAKKSGDPVFFSAEYHLCMNVLR